MRCVLYQCDRCQSQGSGTDMLFPEGWTRIVNNSPSNSVGQQDLDMCPRCQGSFETWLRTLPAEELNK